MYKYSFARNISFLFLQESLSAVVSTFGIPFHPIVSHHFLHFSVAIKLGISHLGTNLCSLLATIIKLFSCCLAFPILIV